MALSVSPAGVGTRLIEGRARRGASLEDASRVTRIKERFLVALEEDASPSAFPAPVYARAFLREYAAYLGLDPEPLVAEYRRMHGDALAPTLAPAAPPRERRDRPTAWLLGAGAALIAIVAVAAAIATRGDPAVSLPPAEVADAVVPEPPALPVVDHVSLEVRVRGGRSWVRVGSGGERLSQGVRRAGWARTFEDPDRLRVTFGNAGAVRLVLNGEPLGAPGDDGEVYRATFVRRGGDVRIVPR